jgi:hypothetical protein
MSAIKAGDLVEVIHGDCEHNLLEKGMVFNVIAVSLEISWCLICRRSRLGVVHAEIRLDGRSAWKPLTWLRKIEPPDELKRIERREEITA